MLLESFAPIFYCYNVLANCCTVRVIGSKSEYHLLLQAIPLYPTKCIRNEPAVVDGVQYTLYSDLFQECLNHVQQLMYSLAIPLKLRFLSKLKPTAYVYDEVTYM